MITKEKVDDVPETIQFKCPECEHEGDYDQFAVNDWVIQLPELMARNPGYGFPNDLSGMTYQDAFNLYIWLIRHGR